MNDEERWFKNTSGFDAEGLCKAYADCDKPFVEMGKHGKRIDIGEFAQIQQGNKLDFSIEFNDETDRITIFDGENFEYKGLHETLYPKQAQKEVTLIVAECGEFHNLGEFYENIPDIKSDPQAMEVIAEWFAEVAADGAEPEERKGALELLEKLAEYKPLAKIEENAKKNQREM